MFEDMIPMKTDGTLESTDLINNTMEPLPMDSPEK